VEDVALRAKRISTSYYLNAVKEREQAVRTGKMGGRSRKKGGIDIKCARVRRKAPLFLPMARFDEGGRGSVHCSGCMFPGELRTQRAQGGLFKKLATELENDVAVSKALEARVLRSIRTGTAAGTFGEIGRSLEKPVRVGRQISCATRSAGGGGGGWGGVGGSARCKGPKRPKRLEELAQAVTRGS